MTTPKQNKQAFIALYELMFNDSASRPAPAGATWARSTSSTIRTGPTASVRLSKRAFTKADHVVLHCLHDYTDSNILRFDDEGKIVEHWDVLPVIRAEDENSNGMF